MAKNKFYTRYDRPKQIKCVNDKPGLTNQQFKNETDINYIISHCTQESLSEKLKVANSSMVFGEMLSDEQPLTYFSNLKTQENEFNHLPPEIRKQYGMSFKQFLYETTNTEKGIQKAIDLGILPKTFIKTNETVETGSIDVPVETITESVVKKDEN